MPKVTLNTIGSRYGSIDALNDNFDAIEAAFENTLSRDGTGPNFLTANLDANSSRIINLPVPASTHEAATKGYVDQVTQLVNEYIEEITIVANNISSVVAVGENIEVVVDNVENIATLAASIDDINVLGPIADDIAAVAAIDTDVTAVADNNANVTLVGQNIANVNTVASISTDVTATAGNNSNITTVAGVINNVNTVASISGDVTTVASISANVTTAATIAPSITTVATNAPSITYFADTYLGPKTVDPTVRNNGSPLQAGDLYFNTVTNDTKVYNGTFWAAAYVSADGFLATSGGTMTGPLTLAGEPTLPLQAATKQYVDSIPNPVAMALIFGG
jgi:hypothetical protein